MTGDTLTTRPTGTLLQIPGRTAADGVDLLGAEAWLQSGAAAVSVGGPLLGDALRGGDLDALRDRATAFVATCSQVTT